MNKPKEKKDLLFDPDFIEPPENGVDALIRLAKADGPEALEKLLASEEFKTLTEFDPRFHPELQHPNSDSKKRN